MKVLLWLFFLLVFPTDCCTISHIPELPGLKAMTYHSVPLHNTSTLFFAPSSPALLQAENCFIP